MHMYAHSHPCMCRRACGEWSDQMRMFMEEFWLIWAKKHSLLLKSHLNNLQMCVLWYLRRRHYERHVYSLSICYNADFSLSFSPDPAAPSFCNAYNITNHLQKYLWRKILFSFCISGCNSSATAEHFFSQTHAYRCISAFTAKSVLQIFGNMSLCFIASFQSLLSHG